MRNTWIQPRAISLLGMFKNLSITPDCKQIERIVRRPSWLRISIRNVVFSRHLKPITEPSQLHPTCLLSLTVQNHSEWQQQLQHIWRQLDLGKNELAISQRRPTNFRFPLAARYFYNCSLFNVDQATSKSQLKYSFTSHRCCCPAELYHSWKSCKFIRSTCIAETLYKCVEHPLKMIDDTHFHRVSSRVGWLICHKYMKMPFV